MIARLSPIAVVAALFVLGGAPALAQEDSVLQRYDLAVENLEFAIASVPGDPVQARDEIERAVNALLTLSRDSTSVTLLEAMQRTFDRARTAIENQSRADMAVQAAVLRGGFRRLVADSAFTAGAAGELQVTQDRLTHVAADMGFSTGDLEALAAAPESADALRLAFEAGAAQTIATELAVADRLLATDREAAYESLATAYGDSLLVQDSPRADPELNAAMLRAAQALVQNDPEAFSAATTDATAQLSRLASAARSGAASAQSQPAPQAAVEPEAAPTGAPAGTPPEDGAEAGADVAQTPAPQLPAATVEEPAAAPAADARPAPPAEAPAAEAPADPPAVTPAPAAASPFADLPALAQEEGAQVAPDQGAIALALAQVEQERRESELEGLQAELQRAGLPAGLARTQAGALRDAGFTGVRGAFDAVGARVNQAVGALRTGDTAAAEAAVRDARSAFAAVQGLVGARDAAVATGTAALFDSLLERPALRQHDLTLLAAQVEAGRATLGEVAGGAGLEVERAVDAVWGGWPRLVVAFVLALVAYFPLRYLNMAFGGGNANWRLVAWALFLLVLPVIYEGLASLGSVLADATGMPELDVLARWSMFTSTTGQVAWALVVLLAVLFATIGLRGICAQFGLLGGRGAAPVGNTPTLVESSGVSHKSAVDWDDEF